ncbi:MAG TPA: glycoside hydrolase family 5 protein, partial [Phycisphaerae bacterium]|nr:glycoside hydrolase family 5 protein [Phycisphaerae bacterium]
GVAGGFALTEPGGNGVMYDSHVYPWKRDWSKKLLAAAAKHPILIGEVGCQVKRMPFIPPEAHEDPYTWAPDAIALIQAHRLHWTAWSFHPSASPCVIQDWKYTPTPFWGAFVKAALLGGQFKLRRMR